MEEDKVIEKLLNIFEMLRKDDEEGHSSAYEMQWEDIQAIENLIQRNKELEKHYEHEQEYINGEVFSAKQMHFIDDEYIPKSKIKEIIDNSTYPDIAIEKIMKLLGEI